MSKRLPEELEAPDLKMARLAKEKRAMEAIGKPLIETNPQINKEDMKTAIEISTVIEGVELDIDEEEKEEKKEIKKIGRSFFKKPIQKRRK